MLKPTMNWSAIRRALRAHRREIFHCLDCDYAWMGDKGHKPVRCPHCKVFATQTYRGRRGRPTIETQNS